MKFKMSGLVEESIVDGPGLRMTVFTQGCPHHCPGCHNPQTHDPDGGYWEDTQTIIDKFKENPLLKGITLSGGDPMIQPKPMLAIAKAVHALNKDVMVYTGFYLSELYELHDPDVDALLQETDIIVDGPFVLDMKSLELKFRGSSNQTMLYLKDGEPIRKE